MKSKILKMPKDTEVISIDCNCGSVCGGGDCGGGDCGGGDCGSGD